MMNASINDKYVAISNTSIALQNAMKDGKETNLDSELKNLVKDFNDTAYDEFMAKVKDVSSFLSCVYIRKVNASVTMVNGTAKRTCMLKLARLDLSDYYRTKENAKEIDFNEVINKSLSTMQAAREYALQNDDKAMQTAMSKAKAAIKSVLTFIGYDKINVRANLARVALAQFMQLAGTSINGLKEVKAAQWSDIVTRIIILNLDDASKLEVNADKTALNKIAASLGIEIKRENK